MGIEQTKQFLLLTLQAFLENSTDMIFVKDTNLVYMAVSRTFAQMASFADPAEMIGKTDFDFFEPALATKYTNDDHALLASGTPIVNNIERLPDAGGKKNYSSTSKYLIRNDNGQVIGLYGIARDVTAQMELKTERERSRLSSQMFDAVLEADLASGRMLRAEGMDWIHALRHESYPEAVRLLAEHHIHPDHRTKFVDIYANQISSTATKAGNHEFNHLTYLLTESGSYHWFECRTRLFRSDVTGTLHILTFLNDVDDEVLSRQRLQEKALTDVLTGLPNRANVFERISDCLTDYSPGQLNALLFIDLDGFKQVNDQWGHQFGDTVLQEVAERIRLLFREDDIFGRVGGDEFLVFLRNAHSRSIVEERAHQLVKELPLRLKNGKDSVFVTASIGIALHRGGVTLEDLYDQADRAMYQAKNNGKNQYYFYEDL